MALPAPPPLTRPRSAVIAGVAAGVAEHLGWRAPVTRLLFVATSAIWGVGLLLYLWLWAFTPLRDGAQRVTRRAPVAWAVLAGSSVFLLVALQMNYWSLSQGVLPPASLLPAVLAIALAVGGGVWSALLDRPDPARGPRQDVLVRACASALLAAVAILIFVRSPAVGWQLAPVMLLIALAAALGIAVVWSSTWIARFRELQSARIQGIRDEQRAEMAAHLHDSVLQTLALIQNRAGASSEVGRIARAQERELRAWLYDDDEPADSDLATDLRDYATALELDYEVAVTVVSAGSSAERASGEVAAAAREAMLNAARHAGGEVSVYIEGAPGAVDVFVRDRGAGFDPADVPDDRFGVRESIIGRMRRVGGMAAVSRGAGGLGTQVHIRYPSAGARA
ncbi:ATP-binding protein [Microbacterium gilvum]|uniref:ATP-binding protein n=1 Tax=Microbacterium gilvum TaxID=1336204 RepID=A0ABP9AF06_9MICO